jgi:hypothetical protein
VIDKDFGRWTKTVYTQHRIYVERIDSGEHPEFNLGVVMFYQKYSGKDFVEIVPTDDPSNQVGLEAYVVESVKQPVFDPRFPKYPIGGLCLLTGMPAGRLQPAPFVEGSRKDLESCRNAIEKKFKKNKPEIVKKWDEFLEKAPQDDNVHSYVAEHGMFVPFADILFGGEKNIDLTNIIAPIRRGVRDLKRVRGTPSVQWRGNKRHDIKPYEVVNGSSRFVFIYIFCCRLSLSWLTFDFIPYHINCTHTAAAVSMRIILTMSTFQSTMLI